MASNIIKMVLKLDDQASPGLKKVGEESSTTGEKFAATAKTAGAVALGIAAVGAAAMAAQSAMISMGRSVAEMSNQFGDAAVVTGLSAKTLETFDFMARASNGSLKSMERGFAKFHQGITEAKRGTGEMVDTLEVLNKTSGFNIKSFKNTEDALFAYIKALNHTGNEAFIAEGMVAAFGRGSLDLSKALAVGDIENFSDTLDEIGRVTGPAAIKSAQEMQAAIALQEVAMRRMKLAVFETFLGDEGFVSALGASYGAMLGFGAALDQLSNFIVGLVQSIGNLIHILYRIPEALTGSPEAIHELGEAWELFQKTADKGVNQGFSAFLSGQAIDRGIEAAESFNEGLSNIRQSTNEGVLSAEAYADAIAGIGEAAEDAGEWLGYSAELFSEFEAILSGQSLGKGFEAMEKAEATAAAQRKKRRAEAQREAEQAQRATEKYLASIVQVSIELKSQQGSYDGLFPADFTTQADRFAESFESVGLSLVESVTELEQMQSLLSSLEAGAYDIDIPGAALGGLTERQAKEYAAALRKAIDEEMKNLEAVDIEVRQEGIAGTIGDISGAMTAAAGGDIAGAAQGIGDALGASPIFGEIVGGLGAIAEIGKMTAKEIKANAVAFVDNLAAGFEVLIEALPSMLQTLITKLPGILLEAGFAVIKFALSGELIKAIAQGFVEGIRNAADAIRSIFGLKPKDDEGWYFGKNIRVEPPDDVDSFARGTAKVQRTGTAMVHRGETIIPAGGRAAQDRMTTGGGITVNISTAILDRDVIPRLVREIDRAVGTYGRTSAAFAGG